MLRRLAHPLGAGLALAAVCGVAAAHGGSLRGASGSSLAVPTWLFLSTGGAVVGASFLLASFVTDRQFVADIHGWRRALPAPRRLLAWAGQTVGVAAFAVLVVAGFFGPTDPLRNAAIVLVWVAWWAGLVMATYLVGNAWPALDPFRTLTRPLSWVTDGVRDLDADRAAWASTAFLLVLVWVEVVSPLADAPRLLAATALGYLALAAVGVLAVGHDTWFGEVDPVARLFRAYGAVAPVERTEDGLSLRVPAARLTERVVNTSGGVAFVVAVLWGTTYDGLVGTPAWATVARAVVDAGVPPAVLYPAALLLGFVAFHQLYWWAARNARETAPTYTDAATLAVRFAPSLLAIAAGYHLAHYLVYFLSLSPALVSAVLAPLDPPMAMRLVLPAWLSGVGVAAVLVGHLLAIWVAHGTAFDELPGRLQAIRSQYALTAVMVFYTMSSMWIVSQPAGSPPFL
ncbi:hypothetical protein [Halobacterium jilantaiense]|uniref:Uncharacterized protein n=1 Tax=Halobacterium jilantaiense TaxID=355548 RepID=A0A1I0NF82_9EURY|nr:hypothetical protein [Halobacterium jilantaiense]SEV99900.1 hypothetical protein SAMN04487945_0823 [Halobacterium jilantaiense]